MRLTSLSLCLATALGAACGSPADLDAPPAAGDPQSASRAASCRGAPYPLLLAHGMAGWNQIGGFYNYFFNVADDLRGQGETVVISQVAPFDTSVVRGGQLATAIDGFLASTGACKLNIIAHSQGGIDARYAISSLGYGDRVASLVTVATPHQGSPVADVALGLLPGFSYDVINAVLDVYAAIVGAPPGDPGLQAQLHQLSVTEMTGHFNAQNPDDARVSYYSVVGRSVGRIDNDDCQGGLWQNPQRFDLLNPLFVGAQLVFAAQSKDPLVPLLNDGLVASTSARWGKFLGCVPADHLDEIGQLFHLFPDPVSGFDHKAMYRTIAAQLHKDGH